MLNTSLAVAQASIRHRRYSPKQHAFQSKLSYLWFNPDQLETITGQARLWSSRRWNLLNLYATDFLTAYQGTLRQKVEKALLQYTNFILSTDSQIRILALPRCLGFRFNSVVFYFILDHEQQKPIFIISEITNTPWNERQIYVHDCCEYAMQSSHFDSYEFKFEKSFHVSPFMPMDLDYCWRFSFSDSINVIHMQLFEKEKNIFDATIRFRLEPITFPSQQNHYALRYSLEPFKMVASIYFQALHLWLKKVPFHRHPKKNKD